MSDKIKEGGAAFPTPDCSNWDGPSRTPGMSLRDYFAGQALAGRNVSRAYAKWSDMAEDCYEIADAMIAAREAKP